MRTLAYVDVAMDDRGRGLGLAGREIGHMQCLPFVYDSPRRLTFWGAGCTQDLYLNCVAGGMVREALHIPAGSLRPVRSEGEYAFAFESLEGFEGKGISVLPDKVAMF